MNDSLITSYFFLDAGKSTGTFEKISAQSLKANVNSKTNVENQIIERRLAFFNDKIEDWFENYSRINKEFKNNVPSDVEDSLAKEKKIIRVEIDSVLSKYILNHRDSYAALWNLFNIVDVGGYSPTRFASFLKFP